MSDDSGDEDQRTDVETLRALDELQRDAEKLGGFLGFSVQVVLAGEPAAEPVVMRAERDGGFLILAVDGQRFLIPAAELKRALDEDEH